MSTNPNTGPWAPNGAAQAAQFVLMHQEQERQNLAAFGLREAIRRELDRSGEIEALIQSKIDEKIKELDSNG